ncbi:MAG: restriction endonuclease [Deltaproteobacteria bacterium]
MVRYIAIRHDTTATAFFASELEQGRLRQGWGYRNEHDLRRVQERVRRKEELSPELQSVWRNRRLLDSEHDGLQPGDLLLLPHVPQHGLWSIARVSGRYRFELSAVVSEAGTNDYGHIVPVEPFRDRDGCIARVHPQNEYVDARLRTTMRARSRMWSIDSLGNAVDDLITAIEAGRDTHQPQGDEDRTFSYVNALRQEAWRILASTYQAAELERLIKVLFERLYPDGHVDHVAGPAERGADLVLYTADPLGLEYRVVIQVKHHVGVHDDVHALDQIKQATEFYGAHAGVVVTTAEDVSEKFAARCEALQSELRINVKIITREELLSLLLQHVGPLEPSPGPTAPVSAARKD